MAPLSPFIIPLFIPHLGCPHRCVFCNQHAITGASNDISLFADFLRTGLESPKARGRSVQAAFYGGNFSSLSPSLKDSLLGLCRPHLDKGLIDSIRISTRPDTINEDEIRYLVGHGVRTVELGVQSMDDQVLAAAQRGHDARSVEHAVSLLRKANLTVGVQLMPGLPGDTREKTVRSARLAARLRPHLARIYPTLVLRDSVLADLHQKGAYVPLSLEEAVDWTSEVLDIFETAGVRVIRMGLQDSPSLHAEGELIAGPFHPAFGDLVRAARRRSRIDALLAARKGAAAVRIRVHPNLAHHVRGRGSRNLDAFRNRWDIDELTLETDDALNKDEIRVETA